MEVTSPFEPTVIGALWRYRLLVALILLASVAVAVAYVFNQPSHFEAAANLVVEDPRASAIFDTGSVSRPERYVATQASILSSDVVADRAAQLAADDGVPLTAGEITSGLEVRVFAESDEIQVVFTSDDEAAAIAGANAVAGAYEEARREAASSTFDQAIEQLDNLIGDLDARLAEISDEINALLETPARAQLDRQYSDALSRLAELQTELTNAEPQDLEDLRASLDDVQQQLQTMQVVGGLDQDSPKLAALLDEQSQTIDRRAELRARRDGLEVDSSLESTGIVFFSPARTADEQRGPLAQTVLAALIISGLVAGAVAYRSAVRNRRFNERGEPELVLDVPLLAEIPAFREASVGEFPVRDKPASSPAEAFRFVIPALYRAGKAAADTDAEGRARDQARSFVITSAATGDGKTAVTANLALAAALQGSRVLAVDADFGEQRLSAILRGDVNPGTPVADEETQRNPSSDLGLTNLAERSLRIPDVVVTVENEGFPSLDLVSRGNARVTAPEFFGSRAARDFFDEVRGLYDVVLIDAPPLLQVAYASSLVQLGDRSIVVIPHRSNVSRIEEVAERLEFLQANVLGYIYTKAPLRVDLPPSQGSVQDILGVGVAEDELTEGAIIGPWRGR